jgi:hypothetical protein
MRTRRTPTPRGSTLLLAMVLLAVLSIIGVAAVSLSSQERVNAGAKARRDAMIACASAAQSVIWSELLRYGPRYLGSGLPVGKANLPDGTQLALAHYQQDVETTLVSQVVTPVTCTGDDENGPEQVVDLTNRDAAIRLSGHCYRIVARCTDDKGRALEVEVAVNTVF